MSNNRSIRDFNYNHSDIFLAIIILIVAAVLIVWRIDIIMDYPKTLDTKATANVDAANTSGDTTTTANATKTKSTGTLKATWTDNKLSEDIVVTVKGDNADQIAQSLINLGLYISKDDYKKICDEAHLDSSKAKAGSYDLKKGMTKTDIAKLITQE